MTTTNAQNVCNQEADTLGDHFNNFIDLLCDVAAAQATAAEVIKALPPKLNAIAAAMCIVGVFPSRITHKKKGES